VREAAIAEPHPDTPQAVTQRPLLSVAGLDAGYGPVQVLWQISLSIVAGELVTLIGGNGAGKTTLLKTLSGLLQVKGGSIDFAGVDVTMLAPERRVRLGITQVPEGRQVLAPMSVEDNLLLGAYTRSRRAAADDISRMYALFPDLKRHRHEPAGLLSGGQQQMLAIARALMAAPRVLLLDEPSMGLSPILVDEVFATVLNLRQAGTTIFLVEQNAYRALSIADRGYVLEAGRIILEGPASALATNEKVKEAYLGL
jgi:branched-chain amino acid transport system ATP-binding protein